VPAHLKQQYQALKKLAAKDLRSKQVADLVLEMAKQARRILATCELADLSSPRVPGKSYFGFSGGKESRPVNADLYIHSQDDFEGMADSLLGTMSGFGPRDITRITYTIATSVFAAHDVSDVGRKASATFFEILIAHLVARVIEVSPRKKVKLPETGAELTTDYVFDPGKKRKKIHLPLKTSTRERAVQAWVHQLILDRIFGDDVYRGVLVISGETKLNSKTREVIEICVPQTWQTFQARVAKLSRVYYLDPPDQYLALRTSDPRIDVRPFGEAFTDLKDLLRP
jgi:hypothetical protein